MFNFDQKLLSYKDLPMLCADNYNEALFIERKDRKLAKALRAALATIFVTVIICSAIILFTQVDIGKIYREIDYVSSKILDVFNSSDKVSPSKPVSGILLPSKDQLNGSFEDTDVSTDTITVDKNTIYNYDYSKIPYGETPIVPMNLSLSEYGAAYIHNSSGHSPNTEMLLSQPTFGSTLIEQLSSSTYPTVLLIHTHGTEAYSQNGAISFLEDGSEIARSTDKIKNVVEVGRVLAKALNDKGINTIHCEIMHDEHEYRNSYVRAEETIKKYLEQYPTISLVIDIHRDAVVDSSGALVRPVTAINGEAVAQVMCVVGSEWGSEVNPNWENNLSLALKLRQNLNKENEDVCRPVYLKSNTYNQEFSRYSLLLEIGSAGNSIEEAKRAAILVADALSKIK